MTLDRWITVVILLGGASVQSLLFVDAWVHRRSDGERRALERIERLEQMASLIEKKASQDAGRWQAFIGDITVRLTILEEWRRNGNGGHNWRN